jgi:hypothetical protein
MMCRFNIKSEIATDTTTNLMWCRFALGQTWQNGTVAGNLLTFDWQSACGQDGLFNNSQNGYSNNTGYSDWRLPTQDELKGLMDMSSSNPGNLVDPNVFPSNNHNTFWSSTPNPQGSCGGWCVFFGDLSISNGNNNFDYAVQLVRDFQHMD